MKTRIDNRYKSVVEVRDQWLCHGCGMCQTACKKSAIKIEYREKYRTYVPIIDESICNLCGVCLKACSGHSVDFKILSGEYLQWTATSLYTGNYRKCYLGWSTDIDLRFRSSSGGIATALAQHVLGHTIVDRVLVVLPSSEQDPLDFRGFLISTKEEAEKAMGSKYCPVTMCGSLREVHEGERIAIIGLPCHIQSIRKAQKNL
ncbi:MAG TPA: coenzyme F420 hydrogenase/dehydrogenase beta subunit N-terminal domain-containing protein, partial [Syntrophales bacterium]|nr:coenzyme F420 hydrogenase/dehydrogenase beta subunit N-terminal domain-containing protein [Syntrophales bacterium]